MPKTKSELNLNLDAAKSKGATVTRMEFILPANEAKDQKEHRAQYDAVTIANRDQAVAAFNGDDKSLWSFVSAAITGRNKRNAVTTCYQEAKGPEGRVATAVLTLLDTGLPGVDAVARNTVKSMLNVDDAKADAFIAKMKERRETAAQKRAAAKKTA